MNPKPNQKIMMIGTPEKDIFVDLATGCGDDVVNDLDVEYTATELDSLSHDPENDRKLQKAIDNLKINFINPPRPGKKLLVLDLVRYSFWLIQLL
jgi:ubiquitin-like domain-containing CTD phosphatase 1